MAYRIALPILALLMAGACSGRDASGPSASAAVSTSRNADQNNDGGNAGRTGALHLTKECSTYLGRAGDFCTVASSNVEAIKVGSRVVYQQAAGPISLNSDVIVYPPNSGKSIAFGHCALDFATGLGHCDFSGGTGRFSGFRASVTVSCVGAICALDGTYSFSNRGDEDDRD